MRTRSFFLVCLLLTGVPSVTEIMAQQLSYFPLEPGNSWTYRVVPHGLPPSHSFDTVMTVGTDTLMPNGKRYLKTSWGALRVDSTSGIVWKYEPYASRPLTDSTRHCTDTTETEFINLSIDSTTTYTLCPGPPSWEVHVPDTLASIGQLPIQRKALYWSQWPETRSFADSIGLFYIEYNMFVYTTWELVRALVYGNVYTPVELQYFRANATDGAVILQWKSAKETDNMGFEVERRHAGFSANAWTKLGFVQAKGDHATYMYADHLSNVHLMQGPLDYRLRQIDFSGSYWLSPYVRIAQVSSGITPETLEIFPLPVRDAATVRLTGLSSRVVHYSVHNTEGKRITSGMKAVLSGTTTELHLTLTGIPAGMYYVLIRDRDNIRGRIFPLIPSITGIR